jgi:transposase
MMLLLLYDYCVGIVSSRKIERASDVDLALRVLTANQQPDHSRIREFCRRNLDALKGLFVQILRLCQKTNGVRCPERPIPEPPWPFNSGANREQRSTLSAR